MHDGALVLVYLRVIVSVCEGKLSTTESIHEGALSYLRVVVSAREGKVDDHTQGPAGVPHTIHQLGRSEPVQEEWQ